MVIYLEPNEEITSIVDHLIQAEQKEVVFVVPIGAQILQSLLNLKLLKREADNLGKRIIFLTQDEYGKNLINKAEMNVISSREDIDEFLNKFNQVATATKLGEETVGVAEVLLAKNDLRDKFFPNMENEPLRVADIISPSDVYVSNQRLRNIEKSAGRGYLPTPTSQRDVRRGVLGGKSIDWREEKEIQDKVIQPGQMVVKVNLYRACRSVADTAYQRLCQIGQVAYRFNPKKIFFVSIFLFIGAMVLIGLFVLPKAEIILRPKMENIASDFNLTADETTNKTDLTLKKIPLQSIKLEKRETREFSVLGEQQVNEKARGKIFIYNEYSSSPQTLVETTRFLSEDGKIFRLPKTVVVPGAAIEEGKIVPSFVEVEIFADQPGKEYNINPNQFTIPGFQGTPKYNKFYAKSFSAMSGGAVGRVKIVSQEDFNNAKDNILNDLRSVAYSQMKDGVPNGFKLIDDAIREKIDNILVDPPIGAVAEKFNLTANLTFEGLIFNEDDVNGLFLEDFKKQVSEQSDFIDKYLIIEYKKISADFLNKKINFIASFSGKTKEKIDIDKIRIALRNKGEGEIEDFFSQSENIESIKVNFWPFWVKKIPQNIQKIKIELEF